MITLWLTTALAFATALLLAWTGRLTLGREAQGPARVAQRAFAVWWFGAATVLLLIGIRNMLYLGGLTDPPLYIVARNLMAFALAVALPGLLHYLVFIYTGRERTLGVLVVAYVLFFAFSVYYFSLSDVDGVEATAWSVRTVGDTVAPAWMSVLFGVLVAGPILGAVVAYASLYRRVHEPEQRYRIAMVSGAFALLFVPLLVGFVLGLNRRDWFALVYEVPGLVAAFLIILAYRPPEAVRRRWDTRRE